MFIVIKSEHYDCTNLICKKDTLEEAVAAVKDSMAQRINKNYHAGLTGTDITHENEDHYGFSFTFDENRNADSSEPRAYSTYDYWNGDDQESVEWVVYEVTTDKPFFLLSYEEYESIELTGFYDSFDEAFEEMKELIAESVNDVFDEDATADDVEDMEDYNVFVHSNKDSQDTRQRCAARLRKLLRRLSKPRVDCFPYLKYNSSPLIQGWAAFFICYTVRMA